MNNALVIDLEHWYSPELLKGFHPVSLVDQDVESVMPILDLLEKYNVKATFAVLGSLAEKNSELIKDIFDRGHEIASHGYSHRMLHELGKEGFEDEIKRSVELLSSITGEKPIGFRAPSFSIDNSTKWAFGILEKYGFKYDASIFPIKTMLYGEPDAPLHIYRPSSKDVTKKDPNGKIIEFPMTVINIGINLSISKGLYSSIFSVPMKLINSGFNVPIAGGFYLRVLPLWFLKYSIRKVNKKRSCILYLHPWETYQKTPRLQLPIFSRFVTYYGTNSTLQKLEELLEEFEFKPIKDVCINSY